MTLYIPVYKKMKYSSKVEVERSLLVKGEFVVKEDSEVVPFTKLGHCKVSKTKLVLDPKLKLDSKLGVDSFVYKGEKLGRIGFKKYEAPYNGYLTMNGSNYIFNEEKQDTWLLSGMWGRVSEVIGNIAVKIETQTVDINFVAYTDKELMGELIVFPNPKEGLDLEYLEKFATNVKDKIIYVGHNLREEVYNKAISLGVGGIVAGSVDLRLYSYAKSQKTALGITTGFGKYETPQYIFDFLKTISNRHVFMDGSKGYLRVPIPQENNFAEAETDDTLREVVPGLSVLVFDRLHFGQTGEVDHVQDEIIYVKLNKSEETVEVKIPNIFALI